MSALSYTECDIERSAVASARETFEELYSLITGRSGDYNTITTPVGFEFSDQIGEGLRTAANENQYAWSSSMLACLHAYGVLDKISADVKWYEDKIEEIKGDLSTALANSAEPDNLNIAQQIIESHNLRAEQAWRDLETRCDESQDMLKEGPTPENIRALGDGGYFGNNDNIGFYTTGDFDYYVVDEGQAGVIATHLGHAVLDGNEVSIELLEDNPEYLALVAAVVSRGLLAQQNGDRLLGGEVEFLETLFGDLDEIGGDSPGFLQFMDQVNSSEHISDSLREDINRNLANSMLILSDEDIGGGVGNLPQDVRDVLEVPDFPDVNSLGGHDSEGYGFMAAYRDWGEPFTALSTLLNEAGPGVRGGTEFSTALMGTVAATLEVPHFPAGTPGEEHFQDVIEVASRNDEANHIIITGEDFEGEPYEHYESHGDLTPEKILETFYTHDWEDGGAAVRGITDWIADYEDHGTPEQQEHAGQAAHALIELLAEEEDGKNPFKNTGVKIEGNPDASVGELNPELADGFADIYISYIDDFTLNSGESGYGPIGDQQGDRLLFHESGEDVLILPAEVRQDFLQLIVANEDVSPRVIAATEAQEWRVLEETFQREGVSPRAGGEVAGDLREMVTEAILQEYIDRDQSVTQARESARKQWETGYGVFSAVVSNAAGGPGGVPGGIAAGVVLETLKQPFTEFIDEQMKDRIPDVYYLQGEQGEDTQVGDFVLQGRQEAHHHSVLQMANVFLEMGVIDPADLEAEDLLVDYPNGETRLPVTTAQWEGSTSERSADLLEILRSASLEYEGADAGVDVDEYIDGYDIAYEPESLGRSGGN
ncbi:hypothetical protein NGM33_13965 [Nocardiopsis dassonvillei]|uniref:TPR repeat region-containing protein n=1 Tax=Nocardiopsis dassonvillei TaxID=2014 RepID=UPI0020A60312|nr:hypothetical protein [Nocardiopsis dassonvillei]MCP3014440.1 hypothetical protein [Nocardiopsis dassonvillei]